MAKWLVRIGLVLLVLGLPYGFVLIRSLIPATVHDQELRLVQADIPDGSNAFDVLHEAGEHLWWPDAQSRRFAELARDTNWDGSLASMVLSSNREALAGWDAAAKLSDFQVPEPARYDDQLPYLAAWKELAQLAAVRENVLLHSGHDKEAFDDILSDIRMSRKMQNGHGVLICYLVGVAAGNISMNQITHWLGKTHLDAAQLREYLHQLSVDTNDVSVAYANTIKAEYQCQIGTLAAIRDGTIADPETGFRYPRPSRIFPTFNFSQTKALFANESLLLVNAAPQHFNEAQLPDLESNRPGVVSMILSGNAGGEVMNLLIMPGVISSFAKKSQVEAQLQGARTILTLRACQLTRGKLPPDLAALVPEFLDEVPIDDFDGQPLRYSPDRKIVYSVGQNLRDDGGVDHGATRSSRPLDLVYKFDF